MPFPFFGNTQPVAVTPTAVATPNAATQVAAPATATPATPAAEPAPLANFATLWEDAQKAVDASANKATPVVPALDAAKLQAALANRTFVQVSPEHAAAITAGGEGAIAAVQALVNQAAQTAVSSSVLMATKLMETANANQQAVLQQTLPQQMRDQLFQQELLQAMPNLSNPAISPLVETVRAGLAATNPSATPAQLSEMAQAYFTDMVKVFSPQQQATVPEGMTASGGTDFFKLFNITPSGGK